MIYLRPHKRKRAWLIFFLLALIIILGIAVFRPSPPQFFTQALHTLGVPLWRAESTLSASVRDILSHLQTKSALIEENQALERKLERLETKLHRLLLLEQENALLRESLGRSEERDSVIAAALLRPNASPYDTFVIDAGKDVGVSTGDWMLVEEIVLGEVTDVYAKTSVVTLFSSPGQESEVVIGPSHIPATARGLGAGNFEVVLPRGVAVAKGDVIAMPAINPLLFGIIEEIIAKPTDSFQKILFKNPVNMSEVYLVEILER